MRTLKVGSRGKALTIIASAILMSGCAASRSVVDIDQTGSANPQRGVAVKIVEVSDDRTFEAAPKKPDTPSLHEDDMDNPDIRARAIARKRGGFGLALGDVLLPEGQTVSGLFTETLTNDFRAANYRVLTPGDEGYTQAIPVRAHIIQFWSWFQPGFWEAHVHNRTEVRIIGSLPALKKGLTIQGQATESMMAVTEDDWQNIVSEGLKSFSDNMTQALDRQ